MKKNVYEVDFFLQRGVTLGGKNQNVTVMATSAEEAKKQVQAQIGSGCRITNVRLVGAQG